MSEGSTNIKACVKMRQMKPPELSPSKRITPVSNVLVSIVMLRREYMRSTATMMNIISIMSKIRPMSSRPIEKIYII